MRVVLPKWTSSMKLKKININTSCRHCYAYATPETAISQSVQAHKIENPIFSRKRRSTMLYRDWYSFSFQVRKQKQENHTTMMRNLFLLGAVLLTLSSCRSPDPIKLEISPSPVAASPVAKPTAKGKTLTINIYQIDSECNKFKTTKATVPANQPVTQAIAQTLEKANSESLDVAGYRVKVKSRVATVDFRPVPNARKSLTTLANCEQLALFGSVRRTLTQNPALKIKSVRFTDRGQLIKPQ